MKFKKIVMAIVSTVVLSPGILLAKEKVEPQLTPKEKMMLVFVALGKGVLNPEMSMCIYGAPMKTQNMQKMDNHKASPSVMQQETIVCFDENKLVSYATGSTYHSRNLLGVYSREHSDEAFSVSENLGVAAKERKIYYNKMIVFHDEHKLSNIGGMVMAETDIVDVLSIKDLVKEK